MNYGNGAVLEPAFGSSICLHSRNRRKKQMIPFPVLPDNLDGGYNSARYQLVLPADVGFDGSSIALYACPDSLGLKTIERIVLDEGAAAPGSGRQVDQKTPPRSGRTLRGRDRTTVLRHICPALA